MLRVVVITYLFMLVVWPVALVAKNTFANGFTDLSNILRRPRRAPRA